MENVNRDPSKARQPLRIKRRTYSIGIPIGSEPTPLDDVQAIGRVASSLGNSAKRFFTKAKMETPKGTPAHEHVELAESVYDKLAEKIKDNDDITDEQKEQTLNCVAKIITDETQSELLAVVRAGEKSFGDKGNRRLRRMMLWTLCWSLVSRLLLMLRRGLLKVEAYDAG